MTRPSILMSLLIILVSSCTVTFPAESKTSLPSTSTPEPAITASASTPVPVKTSPTTVSTIPVAAVTSLPSITISAGGDNVVIRSGPGITYSQAGLLKSGAKAVALGRTAGWDWVYIMVPGTTNDKAWVFSAFAQIDGGDLPIVNPVTGLVDTPVPTPTSPSPASTQKAVEAIQHYLKQDHLSYQYLGEDDNLNNFNNPNQRVGRYQVGSSIIFSVDVKTNEIVEIITQGPSAPASGKALSPAELENKARSLIAELAPEVNLQSLTPQPGNKGDNYFFRWEQKNHAFIQVGYSSDGQLLNYVNGLAPASN